MRCDIAHFIKLPCRERELASRRDVKGRGCSAEAPSLRAARKSPRFCRWWGPSRRSPTGLAPCSTPTIPFGCNHYRSIDTSSVCPSLGCECLEVRDEVLVSAFRCRWGCRWGAPIGLLTDFLRRRPQSALSRLPQVRDMGPLESHGET